MIRLLLSTVAATLAAPVSAAAQPARFEDVVRNLRHPEPKVRMASVRLLREAQYPEAIVPMAALVNDPVDAIQLETIAAELSFFLVDRIPDRRRLGFLVEVRNRGGAPTAFELGPLAVWPTPAPPELIAALLRAVDDEHARVRLEAIYAVGTIGRAPLGADAEAQLVKALDHYDPAIREGAAHVIGRLKVTSAGDALIRAINDSKPEVRFAAMRALGRLGEERAVTALTEQLAHYGRGEGAWSALDGLARIAHTSSIPVFTERLADRDPFLRRAAAEGLGRTGHQESIAALQTGASNDPSPAVRAAMTYAMQKLGRNNLPRLAEFLDERSTTLQVQEYLIEFGAEAEKELLPLLQDPDERIRAGLADVLGEIGGETSLTALQGMKDKDQDVIRAAERAVARIKMRRGL